MAKVIDAVFEDGVFKPLESVEMKEHEKVAIKILSLDEWQSRFKHIIEKIHERAAQYSSEEIEADITQAIKEVRECLGLGKRKRTPVHNDLDHLAGTWSKKDFVDFQNKVADFEKIDESMWK